MSVVGSLTLNNGLEVPQIAFGTSDKSGKNAEVAVEVAIDAGYRHIDGAMFYGNEKEVGAAISKSLRKNDLKREDLFITSKLWCDKHDPEMVRSACEQSIKDLGVGYLDLYLIHWPVSFHVKEGCEYDINDPVTLVYEDHELESTWKAMEELVDAGLAKSIGVSNFNKNQLERIMRCCKIVPAVNQVEVNLYCLNAKLMDFCHSKGIQVMGYAPLGSPGWVLGRMKSLFEVPSVVELAKKYGKNEAQILIRHALQRNVIVIVKSFTPERIKSNFDVMDFELSAADMEKLNKTGLSGRIFSVPAFAKHPEYPFHDDY